MTASQLPSPPTRETIAFLTSALARLEKPASATRILEVGCGAGEVALELARKGYQVTAMDASPEAVAKARARGVHAVEMDFLRYDRGDEAPFDAVVFTRSLHHIDPLDEAIRRAYEAVRPGGLFIADEFALEAIDRPTARWLYALRAILESTGALPPKQEGHAHGHEGHAHKHAAHGHEGHAHKHAAHEPPADPLERWIAEHEHEPPLHRGDAMLAAVHRRFEPVEASPCPYLYRTLGGGLEESERADHLRQLLFEWESAAITDGSLLANGLRFVAKRPDQGAAGAP